MKVIFICAMILVFGLPASATDGSAGLNQYYQFLFGTPDQENAAISDDGVHDVSQENCDGYGGVVGVVNSFFCHMEKDMGITALGSFTKTYGNYQIHAEFSLSPVTINSHGYAYQGFVWECDTTSADCSQTSNFQRAYYIAFSNDPGGGVNDGFLITEPGLFTGQSGTALQLQYDVGSTTPNPFVQVESVFVNGTDTYSLWAYGVKSATNMQLDLAAYDTTASQGYRFALSSTPDFGDTKNFNVYYEDPSGAATCSAASNGYCSTDNAGISTAPAITNGLCINASDTGSTISDNVVSQSNCGALSFLQFSDYALTSSGTPNAQSLTQQTVLEVTAGTISTEWNGMPATPSSL